MDEKMYSGLDFKELFILIIRRWWIIILCFVLFTGTSAYISYNLIEDVYTAQTTLFIGKEKGGIELSLSTININNQLINDYIGILKSRTLAEEVIKEIGLNMSTSEFQSRINVSEIGGSRLFVVSFEYIDPVLAAEIVNKTSIVIIKKAKEIIGVQNLQIIDSATVPSLPSKPNRTRNIALGAAMGIAFGMIIILLMEYLDYTFKSVEDVERLAGIKALGTIPKFNGVKRNKIRKVL